MGPGRHYRLFDVVAMASGGMLSSGLFVLPGLAFLNAGPAIVVAYPLASLLALPALLCLAELATAMPRSGGIYFFVERSVGQLAGTVTGFANWFAHIFKATFALIGVGGLATLLWPGLGGGGVRIVAIIACLGLALLNLAGARHSGRVQVVLVFGVMLLLVAFVVVGAPLVDHNRFNPFMPGGSLSVVAVAALVFVSFGGLGKVADVSGEIVDPGTTIPRGLFLAYGLVSVLYVAVVFVTVGTVEPSALGRSLVPLSLAARSIMGAPGRVALSVGALLAFLTAANAGLVAASRSPQAMSRDGLLPEFLGRTCSRGTPRTAVGVTTGLMVVVLAALSVEDLVKMASTMIIVLFSLVCLAVVIMRRSKIQNYQPTFRAPLYPWLQVGAIVLYALLIAGMGSKPLVLTETFALLAGVWYIGYVESRIDRESAFVHMVKGITDCNLVARAGLEDELRHIALERDGVSLDRFDHLVGSCPIVDLEGRPTAKEAFHRVAALLEERVGVPAEHLYEHFLAREKSSSTVVRPGLAIPHVVIDEGNGIFDVVLVRCREGVVFDDLHAPVTALFALVGSPDQRNYHLKALMHVAHIVQEPGFEARWLAAPAAEHLRDVVLLSGRKRDR